MKYVAVVSLLVLLGTGIGTGMGCSAASPRDDNAPKENDEGSQAPLRSHASFADFAQDILVIKWLQGIRSNQYLPAAQIAGGDGERSPRPGVELNVSEYQDTELEIMDASPLVEGTRNRDYASLTQQEQHAIVQTYAQMQLAYLRASFTYASTSKSQAQQVLRRAAIDAVETFGTARAPTQESDDATPYTCAAEGKKSRKAPVVFAPGWFDFFRSTPATMYEPPKSVADDTPWGERTSNYRAFVAVGNAYRKVQEASGPILRQHLMELQGGSEPIYSESEIDDLINRLFASRSQAEALTWSDITTELIAIHDDLSVNNDNVFFNPPEKLLEVWDLALRRRRWSLHEALIKVRDGEDYATRLAKTEALSQLAYPWYR